MKDCSFFSYEVAGALHLSDKENLVLKDCVSRIEMELSENIDEHSQNIIIRKLNCS